MLPAAPAMETGSAQTLIPLGYLTKSSAKTTDFLVRVYSPKKVEYSFEAKKDGNHGAPQPVALARMGSNAAEPNLYAREWENNHCD